MVKAINLMYGNLVFGKDKSIIKFNPSDYCGSSDDNKLIPYNLLEFEPIPLNKEWLVKFGFEPTVLGCYGIDDPRNSEQRIVVHIKQGVIRLCPIDSVSDDSNFVVACLYVHQLQNLYNSLTEKELTKK